MNDIRGLYLTIKMMQLKNVQFGFNLVGVLVLVQVACLSACREDARCSCRESDVFCSGLSELPNIPEDTLTMTLMNGDIKVLEKDKLQYLVHLVYLKVILNNVSVVSDGVFDNLTSLGELSLRSNNIAVLPQGVFSNLRSLKKLTLSDNKLLSLEGVLDGLVNLEELSVGNNKVSQLSSQTFHQLKKLHHLNLRQNHLQSIPEGAFVNNKNIMVLSLGSNHIGNTANMIPQDMKLSYLNLTDCRLTRFPRDLPPTLTMLFLSKNNITKIQVEDTMPYKQVSALVLDENNLSSIERGAFTHMTRLLDLFLFVNELEEIPGPFPSTIKNLHLDNNKIKAISIDNFQAGTEIMLLSLRTNQITSVDETAFQTITSIDKLELETNPISVLQDQMFVHARGLKELSLNMLRLASLQTDCFLGLETLHTLKMSHVKISKEDIQGNFFKNTNSLKVLDMENSPTLAQFVLSNTEVKQSLSGLRKINLKQNRLTTLSSQFSNFFPNLTQINLARNLFHCNLDILWLRNWQKIEPQKFVEFKHVLCHSPHEVHGQRLSDLEFWQFFLNDTNTDYSPQLDDLNTTEYYEYDDYKDWNPSDYRYYNHNFSIITFNQTSPTTTEVSDFTITTTSANSTSTDSPLGSLQSAGIAIGMALAVIVTILLIAAVIYICKSYRRNRQAANNYLGKEDYVFIVSKTDIPTETDNKPRLTRTERGSTTSHASEDITNHADLSMKVYTLDVDA